MENKTQDTPEEEYSGKLFTVKQFCEKHRFITQGGVRSQLFSHVVAPITSERTRSTDCRCLALLIPSCADFSIEHEKKHGPSSHISGK